MNVRPGTQKIAERLREALAGKPEAVVLAAAVSDVREEIYKARTRLELSTMGLAIRIGQDDNLLVSVIG